MITIGADECHEAIVVGAGVAGIYQLHRLRELGLDAIAIDRAADVGGTWYWNRYPGCRFDSESYTYGYSFSPELLNDWDWRERFSSQPETLRYLNFVVDRLELRTHMQFRCTVESARFDEDTDLWRLHLADGRTMTCRFLFLCLGALSAPTPPRIPGIEKFRGLSVHTYYWPHEPVDLADKRVAVIGTGATGVQVISAVAEVVRHLTVFQRRPNWCAPLNNSLIDPQEMMAIKRSYPEIFARCAETPGGFIHGPDPRSFHEVSREERLALWEHLYAEPGFGIWLQNFREIFTDEDANAEFSEFVADKIRHRVNDPELAERLIPKDHGFGVQRVPLETRYYEVYNRDNVTLVSLEETPIECITPTGIRTTASHHEFDVIIFATGFDAITGSFDRIDIRGRGGLRLRDKWDQGPVTSLGMMVHGFPNMIAIAGPQSGSASINFPRGIELCVDWATGLVAHISAHGLSTAEPTEDAEAEWGLKVTALYGRTLARKAKGWFTGYNSNVEGHEHGTTRYMVYSGGTPRYRAALEASTRDGYPQLILR